MARSIRCFGCRQRQLCTANTNATKAHGRTAPWRGGSGSTADSTCPAIPECSSRRPEVVFGARVELIGAVLVVSAPRGQRPCRLCAPPGNPCGAVDRKACPREIRSGSRLPPSSGAPLVSGQHLRRGDHAEHNGH